MILRSQPARNEDKPQHQHRDNREASRGPSPSWDTSTGGSSIAPARLTGLGGEKGATCFRAVTGLLGTGKRAGDHSCLSPFLTGDKACLAGASKDFHRLLIPLDHIPLEVGGAVSQAQDLCWRQHVVPDTKLRQFSHKGLCGIKAAPKGVLGKSRRGGWTGMKRIETHIQWEIQGEREKSGEKQSKVLDGKEGRG